MAMMLLWDGLQVQLPETMEPATLDRGFIRLAGATPPTVSLRFGPEKRPFDPQRDGRRLFRAAGLVQEPFTRAYNKRFALYRINASDEAETCNLKLHAIDPGFEEALKKRGTKFFFPDTCDSKLNYSLPIRWYEGEENATINLSKITNISQKPDTDQT